MLPTLQFLGLTGLATVRGACLLLSFALSIYFISKTIKIEIDRQTAWKAPAYARAFVSYIISVMMSFYVLVNLSHHPNLEKDGKKRLYPLFFMWGFVRLNSHEFNKLFRGENFHNFFCVRLDEVPVS